MDVLDAPKITFDGSWLPWYVEFYNRIAYWEAQFLSSGTLTVEGSYTADAWGIGGGGFRYNDVPGGSGYTGMATGLSLSGSIAVTIGAGGFERDVGADNRQGGTTSLGSLLSCMGGGTNSGSSAAAANGGSQGSETPGQAGWNGVPGDGQPMCRFRDPDKAGEAGHNAQSLGGNGWLHFFQDTRNGAGYGGGWGARRGYDAGYQGCAQQGALVVRIKME